MNNKLTIEIFSFSYRKNIPEDRSGNGGGFVFDCRGILNPGRMEEYRVLTGKDLLVQKFLETKTKMPEFMKLVQNLILMTVEDYITRGFTHLQIAFGCTGGQHRSVYAAEKLSEFIKEKFSEINIKTVHKEQAQLNFSE